MQNYENEGVITSKIRDYWHKDDALDDKKIVSHDGGFNTKACPRIS